jgi:hypothetical protein
MGPLYYFHLHIARSGCPSPGLLTSGLVLHKEFKEQTSTEDSLCSQGAMPFRA